MQYVAVGQSAWLVQDAAYRNAAIICVYMSCAVFHACFALGESMEIMQRPPHGVFLGNLRGIEHGVPMAESEHGVPTEASLVPCTGPL